MATVISLVQAWVAAQKKVLLGLVAFVVLVLLSSSIHTCNSEHRVPPTNPGTPSTATFKQEAASAVAYADSLRGVVNARTTRIARLEREVASLKRQVADTSKLDSLRNVADSIYLTLSDSVKSAYAVIPIQHIVILRQDSVLKVQVKVIARQDTLLVAKDSTIVNLATVTDSLRTVLKHPPEPPRPERFLGFIPLPSRKASAVVGFVVGVVLTARIVAH